MADIIRLVTRASNSFLDINSVAVDNWTFKLFYKFSVILLISCSVLVASKQFFGGPISCDAGMVNWKIWNPFHFFLIEFFTALGEINFK